MGLAKVFSQPQSESSLKVLGIETSCDETAVAIVESGRQVHGSRLASQVAVHAPFGGVVPEIASRQHLEVIFPLLESLVDECASSRVPPVDAIAVTHRPGLIGALLVGLSAAKGLAAGWRLPLVGVDHVQAHVYSTFMDQEEPQFPSAALVVSGGHTSLYRVESVLDLERVGETVDDAAGEAFDKVSALLGLGYPGGPVIEKIARQGDPNAIAFPRSEVKKSPLDFSFSGLKTAVLYHLRGQDAQSKLRAQTPQGPENIAASFQEAVVDVLITRLQRFAKSSGAKSLAIGGGVACNERLRVRAQELASRLRLPLYLAPKPLCTDNAVMIAGLGYHLLERDGTHPLNLEAFPH